MGQSLTVAGAIALDALVAALAQAGAPSQIVMVDGALTMPNAAPPSAWHDVRLRTPAGTLALKRAAGGSVDVVVFGNADAALLAMQSRVAALLAG
jgi:hypothetical protein